MTNEDRITAGILGFVMLTGLFFLFAGLNMLPFLSIQPDKTVVLLIIACLFIGASAYQVFRFSRGILKSNIEAKSVEEIRIESLKKIKAPSYLAGVIREESNPRVREAAIKRLKELEEIE